MASNSGMFVSQDAEKCQQRDESEIKKLRVQEANLYQIFNKPGHLQAYIVQFHRLGYLHMKYITIQVFIFFNI